MAYPQHFQLIVREGRTIAIDLGAVGGVLRLLPLLARQRTVSEPNVTECLLRPTVVYSKSVMYNKVCYLEKSVCYNSNTVKQDTSSKPNVC